jgi:hypothetical protein
MSWIFSQEFTANNARNQRNMGKQYEQLNRWRTSFNSAEQRIATDMGLTANQAARIPQDVWREMDAVTKQVMRSPNLTLLNDLLPRAKSLDPGKIVQEYRQGSRTQGTQTSLSGKIPILNDNVDYKYDGNIIPVHTVGWEREWRELLGQRSEGFDALIDDVESRTRDLADKMADYMYNGDTSVAFKGYTGLGIKTHDNTQLIDLGAGGLNIDLESTAASGEDLYNAYKAMRDTLRIENNAVGDVTFYVSQAALSNLERPWDTANSSNENILQWILRLNGVAAVKEDASIEGNEAILVIHEDRFIRPLVGQAAGTYAVPRRMEHDNHQFYAMVIAGLEIRADYEGKSGVAYARVA